MEVFTSNYKTEPEIILEIWQLQKEIFTELKAIKTELKNLKGE